MSALANRIGKLEELIPPRRGSSMPVVVYELNEWSVTAGGKRFIRKSGESEAGFKERIRKDIAPGMSGDDFLWIHIVPLRAD